MIYSQALRANGSGLASAMPRFGVAGMKSLKERNTWACDPGATETNVFAGS